MVVLKEKVDCTVTCNIDFGSGIAPSTLGLS